MRHLIYQAAYHFRKLKIKEWLFSMTDEMEDPEEETAEVAQKRKRTTKDKRMTASREKKEKRTKFSSFQISSTALQSPTFPKVFKIFSEPFKQI